jgi:Zn-dependent peptidase ImmA (M78 family)
VWAREKAGLRVEESAAKLKIPADRLRQWESGDKRPSIAQLRKVGALYKRPLAVFFLAEPPRDFDPQREFRRLPGVTPQNESPELRQALRLALFRREAARDLYERLGESIPAIRDAAHPNEDADMVGERIRKLLGITWRAQLDWPSAYAALNAWRDAVEQLGVLVLQTGDVALNEMRGTSIAHGPLPVILLNNADAPHGRIFTLVHELAHILLENDGHRTSAIEGRRLPEDQRLERVGNAFAAAALMPRTEFLTEAARYPAAMDGDDAALRYFANRIKVSPEAILRRLISLHRVPASIYREKRRAWQERPWYSPPTSEGGPSIEVRIISSAGRPFVGLVLEAFHRNVVSSADVSDYLGVQLKHVHKLAEGLAVRPAARARA